MHKRLVLFLSLLVFLLGAAPSVFAQETTEPLILQMGDGRFYAPVSGFSAHTRQELLVLLGYASAAVPENGSVAGTSTEQVPSEKDKLLAVIGGRRSREDITSGEFK
jgi:hypothetical protein